MVHGPPDAHTLHSSNCRIGNIYLTHPLSVTLKAMGYLHNPSVIRNYLIKIG